jgi:hypothetical protein
MESFETSKGFQEILVSEATRRLLCTEFNADLPYRANIRALDPGCAYTVGGSKVTLLPSGHMLGAVQVQVRLEDSMLVGYSGDFQWPLEQVISVDALVVDSTYGSPQSVRNYTQGECEEQLLDLVQSRSRIGPVHIIAHRGTLHRALQLLSGLPGCPLVGTSRLRKEVDVYREFGYAIDSTLTLDSDEGASVLKDGRYVRFYGTGDQRPVDTIEGITVKLSAYFTRPDEPVVEYSDRSYGVALSNHADFTGTLEYIAASGARYVITDNSRGRGVHLALEIESRLGIEARPSSNFHSRQWGR